MLCNIWPKIIKTRYTKFKHKLYEEGETMELKIQNKSNYVGKIHKKKYDTTIGFFTKKQIKAIYPNKNYRVEGEIGNKTGVQCGVADNLDGKPLPVYKEKTHNKFTEAIIGYVAVDDNTFIGIVKNVLIKRLCIILIIMALLGGGITAALNYENWFGNSKTTQAGALKPEIDQNAEDWKGVLPNENKEVGSSGIAIPGYKSISLKANQKEQAVSLVNPEQNSCYFIISLLLPDGTEIYKSKMIPPSKGLYNITLHKELETGTYEKAILKYECYKMDDNLTLLNGANVEVILEVN